MVAAFGSAGTYLNGTSTHTSTTLDAPAGVVANDVVLVHLYLEATSAVTPPAGFTEVTTASATSNNTVGRVFWKRALGDGTDDDADTYTFTHASAYTEGVATRWTGCVTSGSPVDVSNSAQRSSAATATPSVTVTTTGTDRLLVWSATSVDIGAWTPPASFTERVDTGREISVASLAQSSAGSSGSVVGAGPSDFMTAWLLALIPEPPAPPATPGVEYLPLNLTDAKLALEIAFGADLLADPDTWVWGDYTTVMRQDPGLDITCGRADEASTSQPATCSFVLNNESGDFSLGGQSSLWPNVRRNTPVRVSMDPGDGTYRVLFQGFADGFTPGWDANGRIPVSAVSASGTLRRLAQGSAPIQSAYRRAMTTTDSVVAYWPFEEQRGATFAANYRGGGPMILSGAPSFASSSTFNCSAPLPTLGTGRFEGLVDPYTDTGENQVRFLIQIPDDGLANGTVLAYVYTTGTILRWDLVYSSGGTGNLSLFIYNSDGSLNSSTTNVTFDMNGNNRRMSMEMVQDGADIDWTIQVIQDDPNDPGGAFDGTVTGKTVGIVSQITVNPDSNCGQTVFGHLTVQDEQTLFNEANGPLLAYLGEFPSSANESISRLHRLCNENLINLDRYTGSVVSDTLVVHADEMGPQLVAPLLNLLHEIEVCDQGQLWDGRSAGLSYTTRRYRDDGDVVLTVDCATGELYGPFQPVDDDQRNRNKVSATMVQGVTSTFEDTDGPLGSMIVGTYDSSLTVNNENSSMAIQYAAWAVSLGTVEGYRYPSVSLNMREVPDLAADVLAVIPGDRIQITNPDVLSQFQSGTVSLIVEGISHTLTSAEWVVTFQCSPFSPWGVARVASETADTSEFVWRADTDGSTLTTGYSAAATSISVATPTGPLWTVVSDDFPLSLDVGGIKVVATACSGTSSPQTFTVTALPLARSSGDPVRLWDQRPIGL